MLVFSSDKPGRREMEMVEKADLKKLARIIGNMDD
jgi:hypothetical protein